MNLASRVRQVYEKHPYPSVEKTATASRLPPMEWIAAVGEQLAFRPMRILVAGCGTGAEAFALGRRFPGSTITAVDFSRRSIEIARNALRKPNRRRMRFVITDLADRNLPKKIGRNFDFISCHGVLSYVPHPARVLQNLAKCLASDGLLYLGVNGSDHISAHWRPALAHFGFDLTEFPESKRTRDVLKMFDQLAGIPGIGMARRQTNYLAGDLFGPIIHDWPLQKWIRLAGASRLHFRGSFAIQRRLRSVIPNKSYRQLLPYSRAPAHELAEVLMPSAFHRLVFSHHAPHNPPWTDAVALLDWRIARTNLYETSAWKPSRHKERLYPFKLKSPQTNTLVEVWAPEWQLNVLRRSDGQRSIGEALPVSATPSRTRSIRDQLYALYLLAAVNLLPPAQIDRLFIRNAFKV